MSSRSQSAQGGSGEGILMQGICRSWAASEEVPPTMPANFNQELVELRACLRVAARKLGFAFAVIVWSECRRTRTQTAQKFGKFHTRFGTVEPGFHR